MDMGTEFRIGVARNRELIARRVLDPEATTREKLLIRSDKARNCCVTDESLISELIANATLPQSVPFQFSFITKGRNNKLITYLEVQNVTRMQSRFQFGGRSLCVNCIASLFGVSRRTFYRRLVDRARGRLSWEHARTGQRFARRTATTATLTRIIEERGILSSHERQVNLIPKS